MNTDKPLSLDHVGFMVRDLDQGVTLWRSLGFLLSPRSPQMGKTPGRAEITPWATSNHCVMFKQGYLELIGVTEAENFNPWAHFMERFEGPHIAALRCGNADNTYSALSARIDGFDPPLQRRRDFVYKGDSQPFEFRNIFSQDECFPEGRFILIEHQTPNVIWRPDLMTHPNGAVGLKALIFCSENPQPTRDRLTSMTGESSRGIAGGGETIPLPGGGDLTVIDRSSALTRYPGATINTGPHILGAVVEVENLSHVETILTDNAVVYQRAEDGGVWIDPQYANGGVIHFQQA